MSRLDHLQKPVAVRPDASQIDARADHGLLSVFGFIVAPDRHMFLKPRST
jgi:hypothetical protein